MLRWLSRFVPLNVVSRGRSPNPFGFPLIRAFQTFRIAHSGAQHLHPAADAQTDPLLGVGPELIGQARGFQRLQIPQRLLLPGRITASASGFPGRIQRSFRLGSASSGSRSEKLLKEGNCSTATPDRWPPAGFAFQQVANPPAGTARSATASPPAQVHRCWLPASVDLIKQLPTATEAVDQDAFDQGAPTGRKASVPTIWQRRRRVQCRPPAGSWPAGTGPGAGW